MPKTKKNDDTDSDCEEENVIIDSKQYKQFLNSLFPSKYMQSQIDKDDKKKKKSPKKQSK